MSAPTDICAALIVNADDYGFTPAVSAGIRAAHATRALAEAETPQRRCELAAGLAYWAAEYRALQGAPAPSGALTVSQALIGAPTLPVGERGRGVISEVAAKASQMDGFAASVDALGPPTSVDGALSELTSSMAPPAALPAGRGNGHGFRVRMASLCGHPFGLRRRAPVRGRGCGATKWRAARRARGRGRRRPCDQANGGLPARKRPPGRSRIPVRRSRRGPEAGDLTGT